MSTKDCKKKCVVFVDRISSLPKNVIEGILMCLPMGDAVRTSILSRDWRYSWSSIPQLTFSSDEFPMPEQTDAELRQECNRRVVKIIDHVLLLHRGPTYKFELSVDMENSGDLDRWVLFLSRNDIREIIIEFQTGAEFMLPSCLFSCEGITHLKLQQCIFNSPRNFTGFPNLVSLDLSHGEVSQDELEAFLTLCPHLEKLEIAYMWCFSRLKVCPASLLEFVYEGKYIHISFENTPMLASLYVMFSEVDYKEGAPSSPNYELFDALDNLLWIEKLTLSLYTLEVWAASDVPANHRMAYNLKHLSVDINLNARKEVSTLFLLFKSCPFLSSLNINVLTSNIGDGISAHDFWDEQEGLDNLFWHLRTVDMSGLWHTGIMGNRFELMFIKFVLANARDLRTLYVRCREDLDIDILKKMLKFRRMSTQAQVILLN
ncbi:F-box/FBD/LRR-repeat protein [Canna indica]|uniref:F-box/FBD/LRR-repeat protein n=1 Tax=Canna indica TaxID=4628 RepID=A0AAQ3KPP9_9LILI|nr:F-box/FBD/LRR-repeat protein [Canna indica]